MQAPNPGIVILFIVVNVVYEIDAVNFHIYSLNQSFV